MKAVIAPEKVFCACCHGLMFLEHKRVGNAFIVTGQCFKHNCEGAGHLWEIPHATVELKAVHGAET